MRNNMESPAILRLPVELQQRILSKLPSKSRLRFVSACKVLSNSFGFSAVHDALNEAKGRTCLNHSSRKVKIMYPQLLCLAPSRMLVEKHVKHVTYPVMSLQALYAQNLRIYPFITQYLRNDAIIILTHSIIPRIFAV